MGWPKAHWKEPAQQVTHTRLLNVLWRLHFLLCFNVPWTAAFPFLLLPILTGLSSFFLFSTGSRHTVPTHCLRECLDSCTHTYVSHFWVLYSSPGPPSPTTLQKKTHTGLSTLALTYNWPTFPNGFFWLGARTDTLGSRSLSLFPIPYHDPSLSLFSFSLSLCMIFHLSLLWLPAVLHHITILLSLSCSYRWQPSRFYLSLTWQHFLSPSITHTPSLQFFSAWRFWNTQGHMGSRDPSLSSSIFFQKLLHKRKGPKIKLLMRMWVYICMRKCMRVCVSVWAESVCMWARMCKCVCVDVSVWEVCVSECMCTCEMTPNAHPKLQSVPKIENQSPHTQTFIEIKQTPTLIKCKHTQISMKIDQNQSKSCIIKRKIGQNW